MAGKRKRRLLKWLLTPRVIPVLEKAIAEIAPQRHYSVGGNVAWVTTQDVSASGDFLQQLQLSGMPIIGETGHGIIGKQPETILSERVKSVLDPDNKFV